MKQETEKKIRRLTKNQATALRTYIAKPIATSLATVYSGQSSGGIHSSLERIGILGPAGRERRNIRWEIVDPDLAADVKENGKAILDLIEKIWK